MVEGVIAYTRGAPHIEPYNNLTLLAHLRLQLKVTNASTHITTKHFE
jgi:hypothetical protein